LTLGDDVAASRKGSRSQGAERVVPIEQRHYIAELRATIGDHGFPRRLRRTLGLAEGRA
jgi:hypothetical protein